MQVYGGQPQYAGDLTLWSIKTSIIVPGPSLAAPIVSRMPAGLPTRMVRLSTKPGRIKDLEKKIQDAFAAIVPPDADAAQVAKAIVNDVHAPFGKRPFCVRRSHA